MKTARDLARDWQVGVSTVYEAHGRVGGLPLRQRRFRLEGKLQ